ncbi:MAG: zinc-ribbon domain-containing protein [Clostridia bacterium]|nr:zinc-ribbon domain-containing protein [Clostridia bacterium]
MAYCKKCGAQIDGDATYCPSCGANQGESFTGMTFNNDVGLDRASGKINIGQMIWAIINLVSCCQILGIVSIIMVVLAKDAPSAQEETKKVRCAMICNIIGTVGGIIVTVLSAVYSAVILEYLGSSGVVFS